MLLQNGDTVSVPAAAQFFVSGHVVRPGAYRYKAGLTVFQALTQAGGVTERGSSKRVRIVRMIAGKQKEVKAKLTDAVQPEDTLEVLERFF